MLEWIDYLNGMIISTAEIKHHLYLTSKYINWFVLTDLISQLQLISWHPMSIHKICKAKVNICHLKDHSLLANITPINSIKCFKFFIKTIMHIQKIKKRHHPQITWVYNILKDLGSLLKLSCFSSFIHKAILETKTIIYIKFTKNKNRSQISLCIFQRVVQNLQHYSHSNPLNSNWR